MVGDVDSRSARRRRRLAGYVDIVHRLRDTGPAIHSRCAPSTSSRSPARSAATARRSSSRIAEVLGCTPVEARRLHGELLRRKVILPVAGLAAGMAAFAGVAYAAQTSAAPAHAHQHPGDRRVRAPRRRRPPRPSSRITSRADHDGSHHHADHDRADDRLRRTSRPPTTTAPHGPTRPSRLGSAPADAAGDGRERRSPTRTIRRCRCCRARRRSRSSARPTPSPKPVSRAPVTRRLAAGAGPCGYEPRCQAFSRTKARTPDSDIDTPSPEWRRPAHGSVTLERSDRFQ